MIQVFSTPDLLADAVARHIVACAADSIASRGRFTLALAGGSTPRAAYSRLASGDSRLATRDSRLELDWQRTHIVFGDERSVPPDDPRSNYRMAKEALLEHVPIPASQIHRIRGEDDPGQAAANYETELRTLLTGHPSLGLRMTMLLDLVLLGLGEDGHTASLFPGQRSVREPERWVVAVPAPDGKLWRVTLTPPILNAARNVTFVVSGASKADPMRRVLEGPLTPDLLPAQAIHPVHGRLAWMADEAAAHGLRTNRAST